MRNSHLYMMVGILLGWGAPTGALLLRFFVFQRSDISLYLFIGQDWSQNAFFYWYMLIGTCLSFSITGFLLGREADLRIQ
jgi:hypothetical protein